MPTVTGYPQSYAVRYCRTEVLEFRDRWPCSDLPDSPIEFEFCNGDLVDVSTDYDGPDLLALSRDAGEFAAVHFDRPDFAR